MQSNAAGKSQIGSVIATLASLTVVAGCLAGGIAWLAKIQFDLANQGKRLERVEEQLTQRDRELSEKLTTIGEQLIELKTEVKQLLQS